MAFQLHTCPSLQCRCVSGNTDLLHLIRLALSSGALCARPKIKASLQVMDMFVEQTHLIQNDARLADKSMRFTDTRTDEQERGISLKMTPMSFILEASSSKSYLINMIDTPGKSRSLPCRNYGIELSSASETYHHS